MASHTKTTWTHVRRSPYQALAAVLIMMVTFLTISVFTFLVIGSEKIISFFESKPQVTAFFKDEATTDNISSVKRSLQATGKVVNIKFVSKDQALSIYKEQNKSDPLLLELVTADILPPSLEVSTYNISDLSQVADILKSSSFVDKVIFQKDVVSTLSSWTSATRKIGLSISSVLAFVSILIMVTIISLKVAQKKEEIEIMRLIGATGWYISFPFIYEGMLYAVTGAFLGWVITVAGIFYITPFLSTFLKGIPILPVDPILLLVVLACEVLLAILLGFFSSILAVNRYLK